MALKVSRHQCLWACDGTPGLLTVGRYLPVFAFPHGRPERASGRCGLFERRHPRLPHRVLQAGLVRDATNAESLIESNGCTYPGEHPGQPCDAPHNQGTRASNRRDWPALVKEIGRGARDGCRKFPRGQPAQVPVNRPLLRILAQSHFYSNVLHAMSTHSLADRQIITSIGNHMSPQER